MPLSVTSKKYRRIRRYSLFLASGPKLVCGGGANDKLPARGELGSQFAALYAADKIRVETQFNLSHYAGLAMLCGLEQARGPAAAMSKRTN